MHTFEQQAETSTIVSGLLSAPKLQNKTFLLRCHFHGNLTRIFTLLWQIWLMISEIASFIADTFISALQTERLGRCREQWL